MPLLRTLIGVQELPYSASSSSLSSPSIQGYLWCGVGKCCAIHSLLNVLFVCLARNNFVGQNVMLVLLGSSDGTHTTVTTLPSSAACSHKGTLCWVQWRDKNPVWMVLLIVHLCITVSTRLSVTVMCALTSPPRSMSTGQVGARKWSPTVQQCSSAPVVVALNFHVEPVLW